MRNSSRRFDLPGVTPENKWRSTEEFGPFKYKATAQAAAFDAVTEFEPDLSPLPDVDSIIVASDTTRSEIQDTPPKGSGWVPPKDYYFDKISNGFTTAYIAGSESSVYVREERDWMSRKQYYATGSYRPSHVGGRGLVQPEHGNPPSQKGRLIQAAQKEIKSNGFNAALALIESRQTIGMTAEYFRRMAGIVKSVRKKDPRILRESFRVIKGSGRYQKKSADLWLETAYGLRPLISDVNGLFLAFEKGITEKEQLVVSKKGSRTESTHVTSQTLSAHGNNTPYRSIPYEVSHSTRLDEGYVLWFGIQNPSMLLSKELGFQNPLSVAWDMVPLWSLLTDWVVPIGQYLDLLDWKHGLYFKGGAYTKFLETTSEVVPVPYRKENVAFTGESSPGRAVRFERDGFQKPPIVAPPKIRNPFRVERAISSVALLRQRLN